MIIKIGDKVYCKKTRKTYNTGLEKIYLRGKYYTVTGVYDDNIIIESENKTNYRFILENHMYINSNIYYEFFKHFLSENELRKLKLRKLKRLKTV